MRVYYRTAMHIRSRKGVNKYPYLTLLKYGEEYHCLNIFANIIGLPDLALVLLMGWFCTVCVVNVCVLYVYVMFV